MSKLGPEFSTRSRNLNAGVHRSVEAIARERTKLDLPAVAEALTDPRLGHPDMASIARRLGVAKPTLYRMAGSREELIALSIDAEAERLLDAIHRTGLAGIFEFAEHAPAGLLLLFGGRYEQSRQAVRRIEYRVRDLIARGPDAATEAPAADPGAAAAALIAAAAAVALRASAAGAPVTAERLSSDFDAVAKAMPAIWDTASMESAPDPA